MNISSVRSLRSAAPAADTLSGSPQQPTRLALAIHGALVGLALAGAVVPAVAMAQTATTAPRADATLPVVTVTANSQADGPHAGGQQARGASLGLLGTEDNMDVPFSVTSYTSELLQDQQARTVAEALINDASVRLTTGANGFDDTYQIRGFQVPGQDVGFNGLYGLISPSRVPPQITERVELLKGPNTLVNGMAPGGSIGGGINIVSKRAGDTPLTRLTFLGQSASNFGAHLDSGARFGDHKEWGIRFNGVARDGEATIDNGNVTNGVGALAVDYRGSKLRWLLDAVVQRDDTKEFRPQISFANTTTYIPEPPDSRSNWYPGTNLQQRDTTVATRVEYDFTNALTAYAAIGYRDGETSQIFPVSSGLNQTGNFSVRNSYYDSYTKTTSGSAGVRWKFDTFGVVHTLNLGATLLDREEGNAYIQSAGSTNSNIYNPSPLPVITAARTPANKSAETTLTSFAIADTLSFAQDRVLVTLGARNQKVEQQGFNTTTGAPTTNYDSSAVSPVVGVVVKPLTNVSVYANYTEGLSSGTIVGAQYLNRGEVLEPYKSTQYETGLKVDWGRLTTTAAIYQISRPNGMALGTAPNQVYGYFGEQRNRGLELSGYGEIQRGLRGLLSMAFVDAEQTKTPGGATDGKTAAGVPDMTASGSLDWDTPWAQGLALNTRVIYTSGAYMNATNTLKFDSWTRWDIGARYTTLLGGKPVVLRANIENLLDKEYWLTAGNYVTVGAPRTYVLSASFDF
ncbi:TonB-dependent receptor [Uliginosibacterium sp. H1]|uniref:TonB-dependent receptor n=1 Tax=Uliginosibacterium sp. H1 TaxID=3114757 RepID=UPI002E1993AA|nr:TonB-dependent siderophore receptor [Uliginosibacterium sp. H1]